MTLPKNVLRFEALLYASLMLDALSVAVQDRSPRVNMTDAMIAAATLINGIIILGLFYLVWLAAHRRKNWPRWVIIAALTLTVLSMLQIIAQGALELDSAIEIVSCVLTAMGLYYSFSGDARGWFNG